VDVSKLFLLAGADANAYYKYKSGTRHAMEILDSAFQHLPHEPVLELKRMLIEKGANEEYHTIKFNGYQRSIHRPSPSSNHSQRSPPIRKRRWEPRNSERGQFSRVMKPPRNSFEYSPSERHSQYDYLREPRNVPTRPEEFTYMRHVMAPRPYHQPNRWRPY